MRRVSVLVVLCLCLVAGVKAQKSSLYERKDFSFKMTTEKDSDGKIRTVKLHACVGSNAVSNFTFKVVVPTEDIGEITEPDINFDGYPDVDINLGYKGGFSNNVQHEALLWNQKKHCFEVPEGYSDIGEPQFDGEKKVIFTTLSAGPDARVTTYYRWQGSTLCEYLSDTWKIDDDKVADFSDMLNLPLFRLDAKLNGRTPVIIAFQKNEDGVVAGYIYYPRAKNPAPIMIKGIFDGIYDLMERLPDGTTTGYLSLKCDKDQKWSGAWANPVTHKSLEITDIIFSHEVPKWFTKSLFLE